MKIGMVGLIILALLFVWCGSYVAIAAPGDGQTGMVTFPAWGLGITLAGVSVAMGALKKNNREFFWTCAFLAVVSVVWSFFASWQYESNFQSSLREKNSLSNNIPTN
jgi:hypothetical protein